MLSKLREAFPELVWQGGERSSGAIHLAGESEGKEAPSGVGVHLLREKQLSPFALTIRVPPTEEAKAQADALKKRVMNALVFARAPLPPDLYLPHILGPVRPISPQVMPLSPIVRSTKLEVQEMAGTTAPKDFRFRSVLFIPEVIEPAIEPRLRKAFPELVWEDCAENWGKVRIEGASRESPKRVIASIARNEPPGDFKLAIRVSAGDQPEAEKSHRVFIDRLTRALTGWSQFHLPEFKSRPPAGIDIDREEIVELFFPLETGWIKLRQPNADILVSRILLEALSVKGEILDSGAKEPEKYPDSIAPEGRAAALRGARARLILEQAKRTGSDKGVELDMGLLREAHSFIGELIESGLAHVFVYAYGDPTRRLSSSPRHIKVRYFGNRLAPTAGFGYISHEAAGVEILRLDWWVA
jgi:hypothetical protein